MTYAQRTSTGSSEDEKQDALEELQPFPVETVMSWKHRVDEVEAQLAAARLLLDPDRQDEPDEENALRAFEVLGGTHIHIPKGGEVMTAKDDLSSCKAWLLDGYGPVSAFERIEEIVVSALEWDEIEKGYRVGTHDQAGAIDQALLRLSRALHTAGDES